MKEKEGRNSFGSALTSGGRFTHGVIASRTPRGCLVEVRYRTILQLSEGEVKVLMGKTVLRQEWRVDGMGMGMGMGVLLSELQLLSGTGFI